MQVTAASVKDSPTPSVHRLRLGLPVSNPVCSQLSPLSVGYGPEGRLRHWCSSYCIHRYTWNSTFPNKLKSVGRERTKPFPDLTP